LTPTSAGQPRGAAGSGTAPRSEPAEAFAIPSAGRRDGVLLGVVFANCGVLTFTVMDAVIKGVSQDFPTGELIFFRNVFAFIPVLLLAWLQDRRLTLTTHRPWGHVMRGASGVISMYCAFLSYQKMPLSAAIALGLSGPIFITVLSVPLLQELVGWRRWTAVIVGFLGVLIMTRPDPALFDWNAIWPLLAAIFYAIAMISIRKLSATEKSSTIVFHFTAFAALASLLTIPLGWTRIDWLGPRLAWVMPHSIDQFGRVALIGTMGGCAQILMTKAYQRASASVVAPFDYTALVYGFLLGWMFFGELPDGFLIVGGGFVVASGVYIIHRETVVARAQRRQPPVPPLPTNL
jgi:drug/metabolite transporter (DMT)-like permease